MNIMDFVDSIKLQLSDLEKVGELGYVDGISNIIVKNLKELDEQLQTKNDEIRILFLKISKVQYLSKACACRDLADDSKLQVSSLHYKAALLLDEVDRLRRAMGFAVLIVSHDLPLMLERCDHIGVMYAGRLVETAPVEVMRTGPAHPYARHLVAAHATLDGPRRFPPVLEGRPPDLREPPPGCRFHPRCRFAVAACSTAVPELKARGANRSVRCFRADEIAAGARPTAKRGGGKK
jgi:oligopeptide/dipeptide ABC transporter ATP-binding protein